VDRLDHGPAPAAGHVDVEEDDVGLGRADALDGAVDVAGVADDGDVRAELGPHASPEQPVVVDEEDADRVAHEGTSGVRVTAAGTARRWLTSASSGGRWTTMVGGTHSSTSVPCPGAVAIVARPP
jgi:hypothetical protein